MAAKTDTEIVVWPNTGEPEFAHDVAALSHRQAAKIREVAAVMRCKPAELVAALAMAWIDMAQPDDPGLNAQLINDALARYVGRARVPVIARAQLTAA